MSKTQVIIKARDGRSETRDFNTYEEACAFIVKMKELGGFELQLEQYIDTVSPTVEVYRENKND